MVFNSNFNLKFQFGINIKNPNWMQIDNEFDKFRLYVSDRRNDVLTIWNTSNGSFIAKIDIETPKQILFNKSSLFVSISAYETETQNNMVNPIVGGNSIFEIDKASLEIKRIIIGNNWYSPELLNIEPNVNFQIIAWNHINNVTRSAMRYLLTIDQNGKIIEKVELNGINRMYDAIFVNNKIMAICDNNLKIWESK